MISKFISPGSIDFDHYGWLRVMADLLHVADASPELDARGDSGFAARARLKSFDTDDLHQVVGGRVR